jgi:uncharacterized protein (TIGR02145 family)
MKPIAVSVIIVSILISGLIVSTPRDTVADGKLYSNTNTQRAEACCQGKRGNVNGTGIIDLADLSSLVNYLVGGGYLLPCPDAANINGSGIIDLADLSSLVNYLVGAGYVLPDCPGTVTDIDGNVYQTVTIGTQVWMKENLRVTHYRNGEAIPNIIDRTAWVLNDGGAYCNYNDDTSTAAVYGRLYNWYAVANGNILAPSGWHVADDSEWETLVNCLGGSEVAGGKMKETGTVHWNSPNNGASNSSGFSALPGGWRDDNGYYAAQGTLAVFCSSTELLLWHHASTLSIGYLTAEIGFDGGLRLQRNGFSVRCVKNTIPVVMTDSVRTIMASTARCGGTITSDGGSAVTARGVCWSTDSIPTIADSKTTDGSGIGSFASSITGLTANTSYYVRAYATTSDGTGYGNIQSFVTAPSSGTVTDIDGNVYRTVTIGAQVWMAENLKAIHYRNGDDIPNVTNGTTWSGLSTGAYCEYNNDVNNVAVYGRLYNWYAVSDSRDIAPTGWHVPSDAEWKQLEMYLGMSQAQADSSGSRGTTEGGQMKEVGITHWLGPNTGATNESGLSALPSGYRYSNGTCGGLGSYAVFWSTTEYLTICAWVRDLIYDDSVVHRDIFDLKQSGFSVRCVKN